MYNWSIDIKKLSKNPEKFTVWRLEQLINFGLDGEKLDRKELKHLWPLIKNQLDPYKKRALEYLLWERLYLLPNNLSFWTLSKKSHK